ncbi:MAG: mannose-1-phosphate guanylyltransferase [Candidatus Cyclobacteriaceae bacterium M2_1C_046]
MTNRYIIVMAGGAGTRFWPYSRNNHPKQFLDILGTGRTMLQTTFDRFLKVAPVENFYIVTNDEYRSLVKEQLPDLNDDQILAEPIRRNTAPCIAYATYKILKKDPEAITIVTPADHLILKEEEFVQTINTAIEGAQENNHLITIGIKPHRPETGYGYIQFHPNDSPLKKLKTFTEKPEKDLAKKFLESGDFVWNSGMFIWKGKAIHEAFQKHLPEVDEIFTEISDSFFTEKEAGAIKKAYSHCKSISIDYGIMEKAANVYVVLGDFGWSDLGSWDSLHEIIENKDDQKNVVQANALLYDSRNCLIRVPKYKLVVVHDLNGYLVTEHENVILICKKDAEKKFREFVSDVKDKKGEQYL